MAPPAVPVPLPSPRVSFGADFLRRLGAFALRTKGARERREGAGRAALQGVGAEFVGYRPYRPGEDLRQLDWHLYARLHRPFVRVARREASERWAVLLDTSASMGVGVPGKLQRAAEVATAVAAVGLGVGAQVDLWTSAGPRSFRLRRQPELAAWIGFLEDEVAGGDRGLGALALEPARVRGAGRVFAIGDLLDVEPRELLGLARRGRELFCAQLLAADELTPEEGRTVEWVDAETGERERVTVDRRLHDAYSRRLELRLEAWAAACGRHRAVYGCWTTATAFEAITQALLRS